MRLASVAFLGVVHFGVGCSTTTVQSSNDNESTRAKAEIARVRDAFWAAHERADAAALAAHLTEDAVLFAPGMGDVRGRAAIENAAQQMFAQLRVADFRIETQEVEVCGNTAYEVTTYTETLRPASGASSKVRGRYLIVWRRGVDGRWRVQRNLFNFDSAAGH